MSKKLSLATSVVTHDPPPPPHTHTHFHSRSVLLHLDVCACVRAVDGWLGDRGVLLLVCMGRLTLLFSHLSSLIFSHHDKHLRIHSSSGLCCINGGQTSAIVNIQHQKAKLCNLLCTRAIFKQWNISKPCCLYYEFRIFGWLFLFPCNDFTIGDFLPFSLWSWL